MLHSHWVFYSGPKYDQPYPWLRGRRLVAALQATVNLWLTNIPPPACYKRSSMVTMAAKINLKLHSLISLFFVQYMGASTVNWPKFSSVCAGSCALCVVHQTCMSIYSTENEILRDFWMKSMGKFRLWAGLTIGAENRVAGTKTTRSCKYHKVVDCRRPASLMRIVNFTNFYNSENFVMEISVLNSV